MYYLGVTSNIMSLSASLCYRAMVDASIIMVENAHKKLEEWECLRITDGPIVRLSAMWGEEERAEPM